MINDINKIQYELIGFSEIKLPYKLKKNDKIKYITIKNNSESFYTGGFFVRFGNECIILTNGTKQWSFKTIIRNDTNDIIYNSRIFLKNSEDKYNDKESIELKKIIKSQQTIIDKMSHNLKLQEKKINKYENMLQKLKSV
jgi:hypothetical protein